MRFAGLFGGRGAGKPPHENGRAHAFGLGRRSRVQRPAALSGGGPLDAPERRAPAAFIWAPALSRDLACSGRGSRVLALGALGYPDAGGVLPLTAGDLRPRKRGGPHTDR